MKSIVLSCLLAMLILQIASASKYKQAAYRVGASPRKTNPRGDVPPTVSDYLLEVVPNGGVDFPVNEDDQVVFSFSSTSQAALDGVRYHEAGGSGKRLQDVPGAAAIAARSERLGSAQGFSSGLAMQRGVAGGRVTIKKNAANRAQVTAAAKYTGGRKLEVRQPAQVLAGEPATLRARFLERDGMPCPECMASVTFSANGQDTAGADSGDGWFSASLTFESLSTIKVRASTTQGDRRSTAVVVRPATRLFANGALSASMTSDVDTQEVTLTVQLQPLGTAHVGATSIFLADLYGNGEPVVELQAAADHAEDGSITFTIQPEWFDGKSGPFVLRNAQLVCPNSFATTLSADETPVSTGAEFHPQSASRNRLLEMVGLARETPEQRAERIAFGRRPEQPAHHHTEGAGGSQKRVLVHGYCSGDAWGPVQSQFGGTAESFVFQDFNANRDHHTFASLIKQQTSDNGITGCGIVAHSQGGAAALTLYTYFWSCLDYASYNNRMIQSVGTPYQGTAIAGMLAEIAAVFGVQCGEQYDLTYDGAAAWLSYIPSWARSQVYYYTTSFSTAWYRYDYCSLATDLFLDDPDDGVIEKSHGQLSGANNMGHKTGWCHTSGMRDPAHTTDSSRNSVMKAYGSY